jgi:hypothetical protein
MGDAPAVRELAPLDRRAAASLIWIIAAVCVAVLLLMFVPSAPPPGPEDTYVGLTATVYHLGGLYGGAVLMLVSAFAPDRWLDRDGKQAGRQVVVQRPG